MLNNLREGDLFNIVAYDSEVESFRPELQKFDDETRASALGLRRRPLRRRQHEHRRRPAHGARRNSRTRAGRTSCSF